MVFASREDAGRELAQLLSRQSVRLDLVLGLPRGGVVVAVEVARILKLPLDVVAVRKIGHPYQPEFAIGAMAEAGVILVDPGDGNVLDVRKEEVDEVVARETARLHQYETRFHPHGRSDFRGKRVLIVDDGIATGATTEAAVHSVRKQQASYVAVAAPVCSSSALLRLSSVADEVRALVVDPNFLAVGNYYDSFEQVSDDEVLRALASFSVAKKPDDCSH